MEILVLQDTTEIFLEQSLTEAQALLIQTWGQIFCSFSSFLLQIFATEKKHNSVLIRQKKKSLGKLFECQVPKTCTSLIHTIY